MGPFESTSRSVHPCLQGSETRGSRRGRRRGSGCGEVRNDEDDASVGGERRRRQPDVDRSRFHVDADALPHSVRLEPTHRAAAPGAEADIPPTEKCQSLETRPVSRPEMWSRRRGQTSGQNGGEASIRLTSGQHRGEGERSLMSF